MTKRRPQFRGPNTWAMVREAYLAGEPAKEVCVRFDVGIHAMHRRMKVEGWSRRAHARATDRAPPVRRVAVDASAAPEADARPQPQLVEVADDEGAGGLAQAALRGVARAMREGRLDDAKTLAQLADTLSRVAERAPTTDLDHIVDALIDPEYCVKLLGIWSDPNPHPAKVRYWKWQGER